MECQCGGLTKAKAVVRNKQTVCIYEECTHCSRAYIISGRDPDMVGPVMLDSCGRVKVHPTGGHCLYIHWNNETAL